jgi:hypothetical protein
MSKISDGQPLTYDYLKGLETDIANLTNSVNSINQNLQNDNQAAKINIRGGSSAFKGAKNITVLVDQESVQESNKAVAEGSVKFSGVGFTAPPVVVANLLNASKKIEKQSPPYAVLTIGNISNTGFDYRIEMIRAATGTNSRVLLVNYIAVGPTSTN